MANLWVAGAACLGLAGVALGATGTHVTAGGEQATIWIGIASHYLLFHAAALLGVAALSRFNRSALLTAAGCLFLSGAVLFAGGLTLLAFTGSPIGRFGTPVGGTCLLLAWATLGLYGLMLRAAAKD